MHRLLLAVMDCVEDGLEAARYMQFPKNVLYIGVESEVDPIVKTTKLEK